MWKYIFIIVVTLIGLIYALPNLYPSEPAVQIAAVAKNTNVDSNALAKIKQSLAEKSITAKKIEPDKNGKVILRFDNPET